MHRPTKRQRRKLSEAARAVAYSPRGQYGILVVEGDPDLQWRLARMLTVYGHRVVGTSSGEGALALVEQWPVDLILLDQDLPGMSGLQVAERIRQHDDSIPIVLMTGEQGVDPQRLAGAVTTLAKPFRAENLAELVDSLKLDKLGTPAAE